METYNVNSDQANAHAILLELKQKQALIDELNKLRPSWEDGLLFKVAICSIPPLFIWFYPDIYRQPAFYIMLAVIVGISFEIISQGKRVHKRIDVLGKLVTDSQTLSSR